MSEFRVIAKPNNRNSSVELIRYIGAVGIIWFHLHGPMDWIGHAALEVFTIISVYFALTAEATSCKSAWGKTHILELWLFWSVVYAGLKVAQAVASGAPVRTEFELWMLLTGPSLPLWFLPFIYVANGFSCEYVKRVRNVSPMKEGFALAIGVAGCLLASKEMPVIPVAQWSLGLTGTFVAIAIFRANEKQTYAQIGMVSLTVYMTLMWGYSESCRLIALGIAVTFVALLYPPRFQVPWAAHLGSLSLGVFILHSGVAAIIEASKVDIGVIYEILAVVIVSTALASVLRRTPVISRFI